jgi:hypothetical protein
MTDTFRAILDRWEEDRGILEGFGPVPRALLPKAAREGDVFSVTVSDRSVTLSMDAAARGARTREMEQLRDSLPRAEEPEGDVIDLT